MNWTMFPPNSYGEVLTFNTSECHCFWTQGLQRVIKIKWGHMGGLYSNMTGVIIRRGRDTGNMSTQR